MRKHLAIFSKDSIKDIFVGKRQIEVRFSQKRIAPFGKVERGDLIFIKPTGEEIIGQFVASKVIYFEGLNEEDFKFIEEIYKEKIDSKIKNLANFCTIIYIDQLEGFITSPIKIKKSDQRGWVVL